MATESTKLSRTPLADWHESNGGRLVDFAGWSMPVQYGSIVDEHVATRDSIGLFDVSHMGRVRVEGPAAESWLDSLLTRRAVGTPIGRVRYSLVGSESGGILDDILFTRVDEERFDLVVNASNRQKLLEWFANHKADGATLTDRTAETAMIAVQGPKAVQSVARLSEGDVAEIRYYRAGETTTAGIRCAISRTGYTGEDGFELTCDAENAVALWEALVHAGGEACGLAARDTLRLEAGMPLYGHELSEEIDPISAGLDFAVDFNAKDGSPRSFVGREAMLSSALDENKPSRVGLLVEGRRPPRDGYAVLRDGENCGYVTSGTHSPTLGRPIAMAYVNGDSTPGLELEVEIRGARAKATVAELPLYRRD